jgi:hypothetical protein
MKVKVNIKKYILELMFLVIIVLGTIEKFTLATTLDYKYMVIQYILYFCVSSMLLVKVMKKGKISKELAPIIFYILALMLALLFNIDDKNQYIINIFMMLFFIAISLAIRDKYLKIILMVTLFAVVYIIYSYHSYGVFHLGDREIFFLTFSRNRILNPNISFVYSSYYLALMILLSFNLKKKFPKIFIILIGVIYLILIGKAATILGLIFAMIFMIILKKGSFNFGRKLVWILLIMSFITPILLTNVIAPIFNNSSYLIDATSGRWTIWSEYLNYIKNSSVLNFLFGNGFFNADYSFSSVGDTFHPHNQFIAMFYNVGLVGFIAYFVLWIHTLVLNLKMSKYKNNYYNMAMLLFILLIQYADDYIFLSYYPVFFAIFIYYYVEALLYNSGTRRS